MLLSACGSAAAPAAPRAPEPGKPLRAEPAMPTPCFRGDPPLEATKMYTRLEPFAMSLYADPTERAPKGSYGTCTVEKNVVRDEHGRLVAELGCGVRVVVPGIVDEVGVEIGALGQDVLDRKPRPLTGVVCHSNGPEQTRCGFERPEGSDTDPSSYVVAGELPAGVEVLTGDAARAFFAERQIVELHVSLWCH